MTDPPYAYPEGHAEDGNQGQRLSALQPANLRTAHDGAGSGRVERLPVW